MNENVNDGGTLSGVRVVDFGHYLPGPLLGMFLADNGADVISVVPPGGPRWQNPINAALFRGKRVIELDLKSDHGRARAEQLIDTADLVIDNFRPGVMRRLGLDPREARARRPELTWCSITGFPDDHEMASMRGWDAIIGAAVGLYPQTHGVLRSDPRFSALPYASTFAAFMAAHRSMGALLHRQRTGSGAHLQVSLYEAAFQAIGTFAEFPDSKTVGNEFINRVVPVLQKPYPTRDGSWIMLGGTPLRGMQSFLDAHLPGYDLLNMETSRFHDLGRDLSDLLKTRTAAEWEEIGQGQHGAVVATALSTQQWLNDEHAASSETVVPVFDSELGDSIQIGFPVWLSDAKPAVRWGRGLGPEVSEEPWLDASPAFPERPDGQPEEPAYPLSGIRVLDTSVLLAGPNTARVLAQYGAEVITLDDARFVYEPYDPMTDAWASFVGHRTANAGKRTILVDLTRPEGQEILQRLIRASDVVHHNFTPRSAVRNGVDAARVAEINPSAITSVVSLHSYGGSREAYRGHDIVGQTAAGICERFGGGVPELAPLLLNDNATGHLAAFGVMLALFHRNRTGRVLTVNASLSRTSTMVQAPFMIDYDGAVWNEPRGADALGWSAESRFYRCKDGWIYVDNTANDRPLAEVLDDSDARGDSLDAKLEEHFRALPVDATVSALVAHGCAAHRYVEMPDALWSDYALAQQFTAVAEHPGIGYGFGIGLPLYAADGTRAELLKGYRPGMHTLEVLSELGMRDEIPDLLAARVVATDEASLILSTLGPGFWTSPAVTRVSLLDADSADRVVAEITKQEQPRV